MAFIEQLISIIDQKTTRPIPSAVHAFANEILTRHGNAVQAILFYGSCFRTGDVSEGIVDLYLLVDNYRSAYRKRMLAYFNTLLPPNVFYLELPHEGSVVRAKYTVISISDFQRGTSKTWFHSYLWARFAQPVGLIYARNDQVTKQVQSALAQAIITFIARVLPQVPSPFSANDLWRKGLELSYRAELRAERPAKLVLLFDTAQDYYEQITRMALDIVPFPVEIEISDEPVRYTSDIPDRARLLSCLKWAVRCWQGKLLSVLRLLKGLFTFHGGVEYILWKIERHSGVKVELKPGSQRYPLLATCVIIWRLYRRGAFR